MKKLLFSAILLISLIVISIAPAYATLITIDPDAFAHGTNIETAYVDVTLDIPANPYWNDGTAYSVNSQFATSGDRVFGWYYTQPGNESFKDGWGDWFGEMYLRADFTDATNYVEISGMEISGGHELRLRAYDSLDNLLETATQTSGTTRTVSISSASYDIAYVLADWHVDANDFAGSLDDLKFNAPVVPEPATMLLLGSGLVGLAGFRKKFKKS